LDVVVSGGNTLFRISDGISDGISGNSGFGDGALVLRLDNALEADLVRRSPTLDQL